VTDDRQTTFGTDGELSDRPPEATGENDFGEDRDEGETMGDYDRFTLSSLLQKAVRRSDEEVAAWCAWELARSGFGWNLWDRLNTFVVEDLAAGPVVTQVAHYEALADDWGEESHRGLLCAVQAALACARARSTREASALVGGFADVAEARADAHERGDPEAGPSFPVEPEELRVGGRYDAALDGHTGPGTAADRGVRFFRSHGARVGPEGETGLGARYTRLRLNLEDYESDHKIVQRALEPVDPDDRWD
jgi:hypothetical protein